MPRNAVIIGMPRSGTSLTAATFARKGYYAGISHLSYKQHGDHHNPFGYYEADDVVEKNIELLRRTGFHYANTWLFDMLPQASVEAMRELVPTLADRRLVEAYDENAPWVWKDQLLCFTLAYWWKLMDGERTGILLVRRDWRDIYRSFRSRGWCSGGAAARIKMKQLVVQHLGTAETTIHTLSIPHIEVDYSEMQKLPDGVAKRISEFFELNLSAKDLNVRTELDHSRLRGRLSAFLRIQLKRLPKQSLKQLEHAVPQSLLTKVFPERKLVRRDHLSSDTTVSASTLALHDVEGEAEQVAAQRLGIEPLVVAVAARKTWRRSLTEELEQRVLAGDFSNQSRSESSIVPSHAPMQAPEELIQELMPAIHRSKGEV